MAESECNGEIKLAGVDFISSLPDAILQQILSCFPTKIAIRTSVLSKRWKHVWRETPRLSFDCHRADHLSSIKKTLSSYSALKLTSFDVSIGDDISETQFDEWIEFAMSRNAENLSLECSRDDYRVPDFFYHNSSVKQLSVTLRYYTDMNPKCSVSWPSLRSLSLTRCCLSDGSLASILSGCPTLETLILNLCEEPHHLDLSNSPNLKRLEINNQNREPGEIVAPHIHYLRLTTRYGPYTLVDVSSLTEANFNISNFWHRILKADFLGDIIMLKILAKLQNIERLTIGARVLQILTLAEIRGLTFPQLKIKALTVETTIVRSVVPGIVRLLRSSPGLKKITVCTMECRAIPVTEFDGYLDAQGLNPDQCWMGFFPAVDVKSEHVALFMELVLWNAKTLETVVLRLGGYLSETEYQKLLPMLSRYMNGRKHSRANAVLNSFAIIP
ncbi:unnamed protein product [Thlaspi arvense]|uniref:F-box domain-containing protein n=1 Tax=Thlaspi arvense TaxID=13288 RepID=A0AAU9SXZ6_THLAR|nr:unnamed protein product [Thlaspi arvense]